MESLSLTVPAPAKLSLFHHVTGQRADGYHALESLMVLLDFGDSLTLARRDDGRIVLTHPLPGVPVESDLAYRAAQRLKQHTGTTQGVTISVDKRIPLGAGLGGGSSDAASVLLALNRLWNLELSRAELMGIGLQLGADVPFFIFGSNAHVAGIGEALRPITLPRLAYLIGVPPVQVATADIFAAPRLKRDTPMTGADAFPIGFGRNDLQAVAAGLHSGIAMAITALDAEQFGDRARAAHTAARMSGSGSSVFRIIGRGFPETVTVGRAAGDSKRDDWKFSQGANHLSPPARGAGGGLSGGPGLIMARGLDHHPLREFAAK
ncbi:MAG: 4-(cytidine 5'-diphospho)-2-C-methyl-D-erythritol kinase [Acidobacteriota bacterium]